MGGRTQAVGPGLTVIHEGRGGGGYNTHFKRRPAPPTELQPRRSGEGGHAPARAVQGPSGRAVPAHAQSHKAILRKDFVHEALDGGVHVQGQHAVCGIGPQQRQRVPAGPERAVDEVAAVVRPETLHRLLWAKGPPGTSRAPPQREGRCTPGNAPPPPPGMGEAVSRRGGGGGTEAA